MRCWNSIKIFYTKKNSYREKEGALEDLLATKKAIIEMQGREKVLKEQLNLYTEKYQDFQSSLQKSNDIFTTYKSEIEKVTFIYNRFKAHYET